jgi:hypothetical protein
MGRLLLGEYYRETVKKTPAATGGTFASYTALFLNI